MESEIMSKRRFYTLIVLALVAALLVTFIQRSAPNTQTGPQNQNNIGFVDPSSPEELAKNKEWTCPLTHKGHEFTIPYTAVYPPEVENFPVTTIAYNWKGLTWEMGVICLERPSAVQDKWGPTYSIIKYDRVQAPEGPKVNYSCNGTDVVVSGRDIANKSCNGNEIVMDELKLQFYFDNSPDNSDTHGSALRLRYLLHSDTEELSCRWFAESDRDVVNGGSLDGQESGYFRYENRDTEAVICAGTGFTVELHTK
jgi:hypothetical protein